MGIGDPASASGGQVRLTGHIVVPAERLDAVRAALPEHVRLTLAEPGCLDFTVTETPDRPGVFEVAETFGSRAAFDAHQQRATGTHWARVTQGIARHYQIHEEPA